MTSRRKKFTRLTFDSSQPLHPDFFYRQSSPVAQAVVGLQLTQISEMIARGELDPPIPAFEGSRAVGWLGSTLIALQNGRRVQAAAAAEHLAATRSIKAKKSKK